MLLEAISNSPKSLSPDFQTLRKKECHVRYQSCLKKLGCALFFQPISQCLHIWWNTPYSVGCIAPRLKKSMKSPFYTFLSNAMSNSFMTTIYRPWPLHQIGLLHAARKYKFNLIHTHTYGMYYFLQRRWSEIKRGEGEQKLKLDIPFLSDHPPPNLPTCWTFFQCISGLNIMWHLRGPKLRPSR